MNLEESVGSDFTVAWASEPLDGLELSGMGAVTLLGFVGLLLIAGAAAQDGVENQRSCTGHFMGSSIITSVELVTDIGILMIKDAVGSGALGIDARLRFLLKLPVLAVYIVGEDTFFTVPDCVIEQEAIWAEVGFGHTVLTDIIQVTLFRVGKEPVLFGTFETELRSGKFRSFLS